MSLKDNEDYREQRNPKEQEVVVDDAFNYAFKLYREDTDDDYPSLREAVPDAVEFIVDSYDLNPPKGRIEQKVLSQMQLSPCCQEGKPL